MTESRAPHRPLQIGPQSHRRSGMVTGLLFRHPPRLRDWLTLATFSAAYTLLVVLILAPSALL